MQRVKDSSSESNNIELQFSLLLALIMLVITHSMKPTVPFNFCSRH